MVSKKCRSLTGTAMQSHAQKWPLYRSRMVVGLNIIWKSDHFSEFMPLLHLTFHILLTLADICFIFH